MSRVRYRVTACTRDSNAMMVSARTPEMLGDEYGCSYSTKAEAIRRCISLARREEFRDIRLYAEKVRP